MKECTVQKENSKAEKLQGVWAQKREKEN